MNLFKITEYIDERLNISEIKDKSLNGLQVENSGEVENITICVDISEDLTKICPENSLIIVHHGLLWDRPRPIKGRIYRTVHMLMKKNCALYAAHLPLDAHEELGNNYGFYKQARWDVFKTEKMGFTSIIEFPEPRNISEILEEVKKITGQDMCLWDFGKKDIKKVAFISGGAIYQFLEVVKNGIELYITGGEPCHSFYWPAKEEKINIAFAGHYNTETIGIKLLAEELKEKFSIDYKFVDLPTGL